MCSIFFSDLRRVPIELTTFLVLLFSLVVVIVVTDPFMRAREFAD
jgi:hypothetical protein